jgi:hypothetical protein
MSDQLRVDRGSIQQHVDDTRANLGSFRETNEGADRQQAHLQNQMEGGVGSDLQQQTRAVSRHHGEEIDTNVNKLAGKTSENTDEFIANVRNAANKSLRTIN